MKTNKFFLLILFSFLLFSCDDKEDESKTRGLGSMYALGEIMVRIPAEETILFQLMDEIELEITSFPYLEYTSSLPELSEKIKEEFINRVGSYTFCLSYYWHNSKLYIIFNHNIYDKGNRELWNNLKDEFNLDLIKSYDIEVYFKVDVGTEEEWINKAQQYPYVVDAGYVGICSGIMGW